MGFPAFFRGRKALSSEGTDLKIGGATIGEPMCGKIFKI